MSWLPRQSVVVPFDFSQGSEQAISVAIALVDDPGDVRVVHVLPELGLDEADVYPDPLNDELRCKRVASAYQFRATQLGWPPLDFNTRVGDPGREIVNFAETTKADLIVMSSHGRSRLSRWLIGSVAERVVHLARCPLLIIKSPVEQPVSDGGDRTDLVGVRQ